MTALLRVVKLIDELFEFIEFFRLHLLKFHAKRLFSYPLYPRFVNRDRRIETRNDQSNHDDFSRPYVHPASEL